MLFLKFFFKKMDLMKLIRKEIKHFSPKHASIEFTDSFLDLILEVQDFANENDLIFEDRDKYDLHWAFSNAQAKINSLTSKIFIGLRVDFESFKEKYPGLFEDYCFKAMHKSQKKVNRNLNLYEAISQFVSFIDIIISVILIVLISKASHIGDTLFQSAFLGLVFFGIIALLKVTLDRFYVIPKVHNWGWKKYKQISDNFFKNSPKLLAFLFILDHSMNNDIKEVMPSLKMMQEEFNITLFKKLSK